MTYMHDFVGVFYLIAFFLLITVFPSWILLVVARIIAALDNSAKTEGTTVKLAFWKKVLLGSLGGFVGEILAVAVYPLAESAWCRDEFAQGSYCDGQGPLVLIFTLPLCAIVGSCVSMIWSWYSFGIRADTPWASVFSYCGSSRARNLGFAVAVQIMYWAIFARAVYLFTRSLL